MKYFRFSLLQGGGAGFGSDAESHTGSRTVVTQRDGGGGMSPEVIRRPLEASCTRVPTQCAV